MAKEYSVEDLAHVANIVLPVELGKFQIAGHRKVRVNLFIESLDEPSPKIGCRTDVSMISLFEVDMRELV